MTLTYIKGLGNFIYMNLIKCAIGFLCLTVTFATADGDVVSTRKSAQNAYREVDGKPSVSKKGTEVKHTDRYSQFEGKYAPKEGDTPQPKKISTIPDDFPHPVIMVIPAVNSKGVGSLQIVANNPLARATMDGINEYLTQHHYEVKYLEGSESLEKVIQVQNSLASSDEDLAYLASLVLNADIYIKFSGSVDRRGIVSVDLNAYESSTARLLGTQNATINSHGRMEKIDQQANLKTAAKKAMPGLESKIYAYWADDLEKGNKYKVIMNIRGDYDDNQIEDLEEDIVQNIKGQFKKAKVNTMTAKTIDMVVYSDADDVNDIYVQIRKAIKSTASTKKINISKKLIIMDIL